MNLGSRVSLIIVLIAGLPISAFAASDKMQDSQRLCDPHGTEPLSINVPCITALLNNSSDTIYNPADPATAIFLLDASKLLHDVESKRLTERAGKQKFLRLLIGVEDRHHVDVQAAQAREDAELSRQQLMRVEADRAKSDAEFQEQHEAAMAKREADIEQQRREEQEQQRKDAVTNLMAQQALAQQQQRAAAVQFCITEARERSQFAFNAPSECQANPNYYQRVLRFPKQTHCQGFGNQFDCTSQ